MARRANGEGTIYRRADGRYVASLYVDTVAGHRKRISIYGTTRAAVADKLTTRQQVAQTGIREPDRTWTVGEFLYYWLDEVVRMHTRPTTASLYEGVIRLHLVPMIGNVRLRDLSVLRFQSVLNAKIADGASTNTVHLIRRILRAALSRAESAELVTRNVAKHVVLPSYQRKPITPWTATQASTFLQQARSHAWYAAYLTLITYGMRRGEVLGLQWSDIDFEAGTIRVEHQLQRIGGRLVLGPVKTEAGRRALPLVAQVRASLLQLAHWQEQPSGFVFRSTTGTPIDPKNFVRTFQQLAESAGLPRIKMHHTRHTAATLLKNLGVPLRDIQLVLGHANSTTTEQLYQHADLEGQTRALTRLDETLTATVAVSAAVRQRISTGQSRWKTALTSGGPSETRTHDTLLKRIVASPLLPSLTPVVPHLLVGAYTHLLGHAAVTRCCQRPICNSTCTATTLDTLAWIHEHFDVLGRGDPDG